jgi:hypothetical protein
MYVTSLWNCGRRRTHIKRNPPIPIPLMELFFLFLIYFSDSFQYNLEAMGLNGGAYMK